VLSVVQKSVGRERGGGCVPGMEGKRKGGKQKKGKGKVVLITTGGRRREKRKNKKRGMLLNHLAVGGKKKVHSRKGEGKREDLFPFLMGRGKKKFF